MFDNFKLITYDLKKVITALKWKNINISNIIFDTMLAGFLLDYNLKDDMSYMANIFGYKVKSLEEIYAYFRMNYGVSIKSLKDARNSVDFSKIKNGYL